MRRGLRHALAALVLILAATVLVRSRSRVPLRGGSSSSSDNSAKAVGSLSVQNPAAEEENPNSTPREGSLEIQFDLAFNTELCVLVLKENAIEKGQWVRLVADPRTDPQNYTPKTLFLSGLPAGVRRVLVLSEEGYIERKLDVAIIQSEVSHLLVRFTKDPYESLTLLEGRILDREGNPLQGARVTLETEDPERLMPPPNPVIPYLEFEKGACGLIRKGGCGDDPEPYSEEYLERALKPESYTSAQFWTGIRVLSDGSVTMHNITAESGTFFFKVREARPHEITVEYAGVQQIARVSPSEPQVVTMPVEALKVQRYQDYFEQAMRAMILKDPEAWVTLRRSLEATAQTSKDPSAVTDLVSEFDAIRAGQFDFYEKDLAHRNDIISKAHRLAEGIALILSYANRKSP